MKTNKLYIYGKHAVAEALLHAPQSVKRVFLVRGFNDHTINKLIDQAKIERAPLNQGEARADLKGGASHQGVIAQLSLVDLVQPFDKFIEKLEVTPSTSLILLSGLQDPHNVGAIIRSAAAFGASAVLLPEKGQAGITSAVVKVSAGMAFQIPIVSVSSLPATITALKRKGCKAYALAAGKQSIDEVAFREPTLFVLGNEGIGIDKQARALCDATLSIPMHVRAESLNVAASAAVALHAWSVKHPEALA